MAFIEVEDWSKILDEWENNWETSKWKLQNHTVNYNEVTNLPLKKAM